MEKEGNMDLVKELNTALTSETGLTESAKESEEEKYKQKAETSTTYASTTKTVGINNFSFVTVSPK